MKTSIPRISENTRCRPFLFYWLPAFVYAGLLFFLSSLPQSEIPSVGISDKVLHLAFYSGFGFVVLRAFRPRGRGWGWKKSLAITFLAACVYGLTDEVHQSFVPSRSVEFLDLVMDGLGGLLGGVLFLLFVKTRYGTKIE